MLSENQINWIFKTVSQFAVKFKDIENTDEYWNEVRREALNINTKARDNELCRKLLFATMEYLEQTAKETEWSDKNG